VEDDRPNEGESDANLSPEEKERLYQHKYYQNHRGDRLKNAALRWKTDADYRKRELERKKNQRALGRAETAIERFMRMVEEKRKSAKPTRKPRRVEIDGKTVDVHTTGALAREIGRDSGTVRKWLADGTLPGCTVLIGGKCWFSESFAKAVFAACKALYFLDGRGERMMLHRLILEELEKAGESYVPRGGAESDRVRLHPPRPATA
jgi:hypothetical protein